MTQPTQPTTDALPEDPHEVAAELRAARDALLELVRHVPESRAYRATSRPGWTLKHELAALASADHELLHVIDELRRRPAPFDLELRRRRAEAMHFLQQLRLTPLIERLEQGGAGVVDAVQQHGHLFERPVRLIEHGARNHRNGGNGRNGAHEPAGEDLDASMQASELLAAYRARAQQALTTLRAVIER